MHKKPKYMVGSSPADGHNAPAQSVARGKLFEVPVLAPLQRVAGATPSMDNSLFSSKERTFWTFQIVGWLGYGFMRTFQAMTLGLNILYYAQLIVIAILIGICMTYVMRLTYRRIRDLPLPFVLVVVVVLCGSLGLIFSSVETQLAPFFTPEFSAPSGLGYFGNAMFEATTLFAWSAIYFGYHFYRNFQEQQAQVLKATAMAHQAQLKMLRYQLNPHFLFNTLNAISTLVLEKSVTDANKMLTKLSSFLRYTLVNQPTQRVTLEQELYALSLYLEIEAVRFGDRLRIDFDIEEPAKSALIPSLLMQPLIENAIKYAVAPSIEGGVICVAGRIRDNKLVVELKDTGPGIEDLNHIVSQSGSGVGIVNTKERLVQIYGADHQFLLENLEPTGLSITIVIPCERETRVA